MITKILLTLLITGAPIVPEQSAVYGARHFAPPELSKINPYALEPILETPSVVALDGKTGKVLFSKNSDEKRHIASITKLVTSYIYLKKTEGDFSRPITMNGGDARGGGRSYIYRAETAGAIDFLHLALVSSDNGAAIALARTGGFLDAYAAETRELARALGLANTRLVEPSGLDPGNTSTALDVALLAREIFKNKLLQTITTKEAYSFSLLNGKKTTKRRITTTNDLLTTDLFVITAGKTGHTEAAGYCLVFQAKNKDGESIVVAILGAPTSEDRFRDAKTLAHWIFENFE